MPDTIDRPAAAIPSNRAIPIDRLMLCGVAALSLVATRWTPKAPVRSACLTVAAFALIAIVQRCVRRQATSTATHWQADSVAATAVVLAAGVCAGSTEGPVLGVVAAVVLWAAGWRRGPGVGWAIILAAGCAVAAVIIWFGRWLHAWMQVPLAGVLVWESIECVRRVRARRGS